MKELHFSKPFVSHKLLEVNFPLMCSFILLAINKENSRAHYANLCFRMLIHVKCGKKEQFNFYLIQFAIENEINKMQKKTNFITYRYVSRDEKSRYLKKKNATRCYLYPQYSIHTQQTQYTQQHRELFSPPSTFSCYIRLNKICFVYHFV